MGLVTTAKVVGYDGCNMVIIPQQSISRELLQKNVDTVELRLCDGRECSADQRAKIFALIRDISEWSGHDREDLRRYFTQNFCEDNDLDYFSLSPRKPNIADMTTARDFITYLIEFCFRWNVPTLKPLLDKTEDIFRYLYLCLENRKCAICNAKADIHHVDAVGIGRDRNTIIHVGMRAIALCREHHTEAHNIGKREFFAKYHVYSIPLDPYLCKVLKLGRREAMDEVYNRDKQFLRLVDL